MEVIFCELPNLFTATTQPTRLVDALLYIEQTITVISNST